MATEEELEKAFSDQDTKKSGKITLPQLEKALKALGKTDEEVAKMTVDFKGEEKKEEENPKPPGFFSKLTSKMTGGTAAPPAPTTEFTFDEFKAIASESRFPYAKKVDDTYMLGAFSGAFADAFGWYAHGKPPSEEKMKEVFDRLDTNKSKTLDKGEVAAAFRQLGKSERQIQKIVDSMTENELDFESFKAIMYPEARPYVTNENGYVPVPNREKILDVPVLGHCMNLMGHLMCEPVDHIGRKLHKRKEMTDEMLEKAFKDLDKDKDGRLDKKEIESGLRDQGACTEVEIKTALDNMETQTMSLYMFKKAMRGPKFTYSSLNYVPAVGESLSTNVLGAENYEEEDLKEAFEYISELYYDKAKTIDKTGLSRLLFELGMADHMVQQIADSTSEDSFDFEGFKDVITPKAREMTTESGYPNLAKIHDTPVIGSLTKATQDAAVGAYDWTAGAAIKHFKKPSQEELKAKWDEVDTGKKGKLAILDLCKVLRSIGEPEKDIIAIADSIPKTSSPVSFEDFNKIVQGETPSWGAS